MSDGRYTLVKSGMYKTLREVTEYCGMDAATELVRVFGGTRLWIPLRWTPEHALNRIGEKHARRLIDVFGNSSLDVPRRLLTTDGLATVIDQLTAEGYEQSVIARLVGCSQRTVSRLQCAPRPLGKGKHNRGKVDPRQIDIEDLLK
ncbi:Uncharacterised protein [Starkeya nomas]|uniref:Uncharacterized protein n=1 Tax=Starkeya nomas TaxID=2666134 RepID=A0A5S9NA13_9HYPH|nr:hypothetical protein [Starkeya nomas]CAA0086969.1 Uncharacterised protein [Starkeya nomas]